MTRALITVLAIICLIVSLEARIIHDRKPGTAPRGYNRLSRADPTQLMDFRVALKQKNVDVLEATLLDVADPDSPNYARWWTTEQILDLIAPSAQEVEPVVAWLKAHGIQNIDASGRDFIKVIAPISLIEQLFNTKIYNYQYKTTGRVIPRVYGPVHIPDELNVIETVFGLTELVTPSKLSAKSQFVKERSVQQDPYGYIYPGILRTMYKLPEKFETSAKSSICVAEFEADQSFNKDDLKVFNQQMNEKIHVDKIVGPYSGDSPDAESTLDVQYGSAIALNSTFWFWTVNGWMYEFATQLFNAKTFPLVVSMSWGWPEDEQCQITTCTGSSFAYVRKVNTEYVKLGLKGVTLLAASGDQGAPGDEFTDCSEGLSSIFPGASPWVTSVGATQLGAASEQDMRGQRAQPPICQQFQCATTTKEIVCSTNNGALITTGGGFSDLSPLPSWQSAAVNAYLQSGVAFPTGLFNASNRGFPDVAANGHNYLIQMAGQGFLQVDGTSASSPVFAGVVSLLNSYLLDKGKNPIGFANPLLYKMWTADKTSFTDITSGNNYCTESCCGDYGFIATKGWDATTGLGTPNFPKMLDYLKKVAEKN